MTDEQIDKMLNSLSEYAISVDDTFLGLPASAEHDEPLRQIVRDWLAKVSPAPCEAAFRRGFVHGVYVSSDVLDADNLSGYAEYLQDHWRYIDADKVVVPPSVDDFMDSIGDDLEETDDDVTSKPPEDDQ